MDKYDRARLVLKHVHSLDSQFGRNVPPMMTSHGLPTREISDDASWMAQITPKYLDHKTAANGSDTGLNSSDDAWDLFQLWVAGQLKITAHYRGDKQMRVRLYQPGPWEKIFCIFGCNDAESLLPQGHPDSSWKAPGRPV